MRPGAKYGRTGVSFTPILTFHKIALRPERTIYPGTYVAPATFARHVAFVSRRYRAVRLDDYLRDRATAGRIVLTFDDGTADFAHDAAPILRAHGATGTVFLVTAERTNAWDVRLGDHEVALLTGDEIRALADDFEFGSHTRSHADLAQLPEDRFEDEIALSRSDVGRTTGRPCTTFCYPYGRKREASIEAVRKAGYDGAVSTEKGANDLGTDPYRLRRIAVRHDTSLPVLVYKLWRARRFGK